MKKIIIALLTLGLTVGCLAQGTGYFGHFTGNAGQSSTDTNATGLTNIPAGQLIGAVPVGTLPANLQTLNSNNGGNLTNVNVTGSLPASLLTLSSNNGVNLTNIQSAGLPANVQTLNSNNAVNLTNLQAGTLKGSVPTNTLTSLPAGELQQTIPAAVLPSALAALNTNNPGALTNIPAAQLVGVLPAISGSNLTILNATNLIGIIPSNSLNGANGAGLLGVTAYNTNPVPFGFTNGLIQTGTLILSNPPVPTTSSPGYIKYDGTNLTTNLNGQLTTGTNVVTLNLTGQISSNVLNGVNGAGLTNLPITHSSVVYTNWILDGSGTNQVYTNSTGGTLLVKCGWYGLVNGDIIQGYLCVSNSGYSAFSNEVIMEMSGTVNFENNHTLSDSIPNGGVFFFTNAQHGGTNTATAILRLVVGTGQYTVIP